MEAQLRIIASGSSGNSLYLGMDGVRILVDVGVSALRISRALNEIGVALQQLTAVLVTHEHIDHVRGLGRLVRLCPELQVFTSRGTAQTCPQLGGGRSNVRMLKAGQSVTLGSVTLTPFDVSHDAAEPFGFRFDCGDFSIGVATDLGRVTPAVRTTLQCCRVLVIEANHNERMLQAGPYPGYLKRRIASDRGHLSNRQTRDFLEGLDGSRLEHLVFAHLSETNNSPDQVLTDLESVLSGFPPSRVHIGRPRLPGLLQSFSLSLPSSDSPSLGDPGRVSRNAGGRWGRDDGVG